MAYIEASARFWSIVHPAIERAACRTGIPKEYLLRDEKVHNALFPDRKRVPSDEEIIKALHKAKRRRERKEAILIWITVILSSLSMIFSILTLALFNGWLDGFII